MTMVVRYFGGTLLGNGGLLRAYIQVVQSAVNEARIVTQEYMGVDKLVLHQHQSVDYSFPASGEQESSCGLGCSGGLYIHVF